MTGKCRDQSTLHNVLSRETQRRDRGFGSRGKGDSYVSHPECSGWCLFHCLEQSRNFVLFIILFLEAGFHHAAPAGLEPRMYSRLALNWKKMLLSLPPNWWDYWLEPHHTGLQRCLFTAELTHLFF